MGVPTSMLAFELCGCLKIKACILTLGVAIVYDSTASGEYEEALWKARFAYLT